MQPARGDDFKTLIIIPRCVRGQRFEGEAVDPFDVEEIVERERFRGRETVVIDGCFANPFG